MLGLYKMWLTSTDTNLQKNALNSNLVAMMMMMMMMMIMMVVVVMVMILLLYLTIQADPHIRG